MASLTNFNVAKCQVQIEEFCKPNGDLQISMTWGASLTEIDITGTDPNDPFPIAAMGMPNCCTTPGYGCNIPVGFTMYFDPTQPNGWHDFTISAYCDLDTSITDAVQWDGSGTAPSWADPNGCGTGVLQSDTAIYFFYDTTSLSDAEQSAIYIAANDWVIALRAGGTYTGKVYHCEAFGERWVLWPAWIVDHTLNAGGTDNHNNACNGGTSCHDQSATPWIFPQGTNTISGTHWSNDPNASLGAGQFGPTLPVSAEGPTANILSVLFHDESASVPMSGFRSDPANTAANTGNYGPSGATTGSYPEFGNSQNDNLREGYHWRFSGGGFQVIPWEEATGNNAPTPNSLALTDLWKYDVLRAKTIIANHQSSGTLKTFVYPADNTPNGAQVVFPLHLLGAIVTGTLATAPTCAIADLTNITVSNPYSTDEGGRFGQLDQLDFGYNVACLAFNAATFATDLDSFISGGTGVTCDQTDCVKVQVIDSATSAAVSGHTLDIGGTSYTTDSSGYTPLITGLSNNTLSIGLCASLPLLNDCRQWLVVLKLFTLNHTPTTICSYGCTDNTTVNGAGIGINGALNYDPTATLDDGSCIYCIYGCTNPLSLNYNPLATCDDGSCQIMPDTAECLLTDISKQLLEDCTDPCEDNPKTNKLRSDLQYAESLLAQFYQMYKCDTALVGGQASTITDGAYDKIFAAFRKLFQEYQCDNCGEYHPGQTGITTGTSTGTSPADCEVDFGGSCASLIADPGNDVVSAVTSLNGGTSWQSMGNPPNIVNLGNVAGKTPVEKHICYDDLVTQLEACGMASININTKVYVYYDGTSLGQAAVQSAYTAVMDWLTNHPDFTPVLRDPSKQRNYNNLNAAGAYTPFTYGTTVGENVFHTTVPGERYLDWSIAPITGRFSNSVCPSANASYESNTGGSVGDRYGGTTGGTAHAKGLGHKAADVAGYSYTGATGTISGKLNHWVGYGNNFAGTSTGNPSDSNSSGVVWTDWPKNFASMPSGSATRSVSLSKPDGANLNNTAGELRTHALFPMFGAVHNRSNQALQWSYNKWSTGGTISLPVSGGTVAPVQMYDTAEYDTATGSGPKGHSIIKYVSTAWTAPTSWVKLAEEADAATQNNLSDPLARSKSNAVHLGPPPAANANTDDVLVIMFADETNAAYHGRGSTETFTDTFYSQHGKFMKTENPYQNVGAVATEPFPNLSTHGLNDARITQPTVHWKLDYMEFAARRAAYVAVNSQSYKCFLYPSEPTNGASSPHTQLVLQAVAGISVGTSNPTNGIWAAGTTPMQSGTYNNNSPYPDSSTGVRDKSSYADLDALETANPYWNTTDHPVPAGNPNVTKWGGLETMDFGINSQCRPFTAQRFEDDLEVFLGQGGTTCDQTDCVNFIVNENGSAKVGEVFFINGVSYTTAAGGEIAHALYPALVGLTGTITFGFEGAETWSYTLPGVCTEFTFIFDYGTSDYDVCITYPEISCACEGSVGYIKINTGSHVASDANIPADGINGTIINETTGTVISLTDAMNGGASPNYYTTATFAGEIPDGRYTLYIEDLNGAEWKECRLILCASTTRLQALFKNNISSIKCDKCGKINKDFVVAYTLWRALKITGWDPEYAAYIDTNITELQAALTAAESGNCKCC